MIYGLIDQQQLNMCKPSELGVKRVIWTEFEQQHNISSSYLNMEHGTWSITSQHFQIRYGGYERGAWSGGDASPPNKNKLVMEVIELHGR